MANALTSLLQLYTVNQTRLPHDYDEKAWMRKRISGEEERQHFVLKGTPTPPNI